MALVLAVDNQNVDSVLPVPADVILLQWRTNYDINKIVLHEGLRTLRYFSTTPITIPIPKSLTILELYHLEILPVIPDTVRVLVCPKAREIIRFPRELLTLDCGKDTVISDELLRTKGRIILTRK